MKLLTSDKIKYIINKFDDFKYIFDYAQGVKTINDFVSRTDDMAKVFHAELTTLGYDTENIEQQTNSLKGDMFEILSEIFFGKFSADPAVGIRNYEPVPLSEDYGVDATGTNPNNDECVIQCKYLKNPYALINYDPIAKTFSSGMIRLKLILTKPKTIYVFTTGAGVNSVCNEVFGNILQVINRQTISNKIDNNMAFWEEAEARIEETLQ